jgi:hypothetical protein
VIRDKTDDMVNYVVYHYFQAADRGEAFELPPELTEEEELAVVVLISQEEERRAFPELADALALSVAPPPPPGPPPMQPPRTSPTRPRQEARQHRRSTWVAGGRAAYPWLGSRDADSPPGPAPQPGPSSPPIANWSWPQGPFIDLSGDDDDE